MNDISFLQGAGILIGVFGLYWILAKLGFKVYSRLLDRYLDRHPDVEEQLLLQHGKVRKSKRWDNVRVDANGRALESSGEWLDRLRGKR